MSPLDPIYDGDVTPPQPTLYATIGFETSTTGLVVGAATVSGTLNIDASAATRSITGVYSATANFASPDGTFTLNTLDANQNGTVALNNIATGKTYYIRYKVYTSTSLGGTASPFMYDFFTTPIITTSIFNQITGQNGNNDYNEITGTGIPGNEEILIKKSLLQISTDTDKPRTYSIALKNSGISVAQSLPAYYSFGTTMYFKPRASTSRQSGGFGFFINAAGETGYYILIKTAQTAGINGDEFSVLRVKGGVFEKLNDSQIKNTNKAVVGIEEGKSYKVDVKVKVESSKVTITAYVNGLIVTATDTGTTKRPVLPRTSNIALFANLGSVYFDYVYGMKMEEDQYNQVGVDSIYSSQLASTAIKLAYGEFFVNGIPKLDSATDVKYIEEFGPVAREIKYIKKRYDATPAFPKWVFNNLNSNVDVLGASLSSFGAEIYLINNAGTVTPVDSSLGTKISVVGNNLIKSDQIVYMDESINKYAVQEPITFESSWIQNQNDAKNLSDFIKLQWSKNQKVVDLEIFGNPLISVHDIITINYPFHGLDGTQKFIVTNVSHSWNDGLETSITARSIVA